MKRQFFFFVFFFLITLLVFPQKNIKVAAIGSGKPLVFLPSLGCSGEMWNETVKEFSPKNKCYIISVSGFANMPASNNFSIDEVTNEIAEFIKSEKIENPVLIGHSFGGFLALNIAVLFPNLFSKLVIVDAVPFALGRVNLNITVEQAKQQAAALKAMTIQLSNDAFKKNQTAIIQTSVSDTLQQKIILNWLASSDRTTYAEAQSEMISTDLRESIKRIKIPTFVFGTWKTLKQYGITKEITEKNFKKQYENVDNCTIVISETNHFVMYDDPSWFINQVKDFLVK